MSIEQDLYRKYVCTDKAGMMALVENMERSGKPGSIKGAKFLRGFLGNRDLEEEDLMPRSYGMDSRGRRLVRPASAKDLNAFEEEHNIARRRVRVLG